MYLKVYRLVERSQTIDKLARLARDAHRELGYKGALRASDRQTVMACESAELAAMHCDELLWASRPKVELLRETIVMPQDAGLHETATPEEAWLLDMAGRAPRQLCLRMAQKKLLSLWVPVAEAYSQHAVLINTLHPAYERLKVQTRTVSMVRPYSYASMNAASEPVLMGNGVAEFA